ncbi:MAG: hypothetical protein QOH19_829, partial [Actinomycetota bacterium]|nr:hypothetical protein [Actinomycetota bacterium]
MPVQPAAENEASGIGAAACLPISINSSTACRSCNGAAVEAGDEACSDSGVR